MRPPLIRKMNKKVKVKKLCPECRKYKENLVYGFGRIKCRDCSSIKTITDSNSIQIPAHLMKELNWESGTRVVVERVYEGIKIRKYENEENI